ncbi:MAG: amidohydrolase family protein [bacterium]
MAIRWYTLIILLAVVCTCAFAQTAPTTGLRDNAPAAHAFINAKIIISPGKAISQGTLLIRNGIIEAVGEKISLPADARIWDVKGLTLYPGLIDLSTNYGLPQPQQASAVASPTEFMQQQSQQQTPLKGAAHWNAKVRADYSTADDFQVDSKTAEKLRSQGFTQVLVVPQRGLFRGGSILANLGDGSGNDVVLKQNVMQHVSFETGGFSGYPNSLMGALAMIRQTWLDADWYKKAQDAYAKNPAGQKHPEVNTALALLSDALQKKQWIMMEASDELNFLRAVKIGKEFALNLCIRGSGKEYLALNAVKNSGVPVIVPLNYPESPTVETPEDALNISLEDLRHWDAAPENAGKLNKIGVTIALTSAQLRDAATFLAQMRKTIERGLPADAALMAVTLTPAKILGIEKQYGSIEAGKAANFIIADGDLFAEKTKLREVWIEGKRYEIKVPSSIDPRGEWTLALKGSLGPAEGSLRLRGEIERLTGTLQLRERTLRLATAAFTNGRLTASMAGDSLGFPGTVRLSGVVSEKELFGTGELPTGAVFSLQGTRKESFKEEADTTKPKQVEMASFPDVYPAGGFGRAKLPEQPQLVLVKNATIWTQGKQGKMEGADLLISKGKISQVGNNITAPKDALIIDAAGKHVSPGIIDTHSHTAVSGGVNEGGQAITAETRVEDVLDPTDIWIYRQLAGGTTAAHVLHGSANPIGALDVKVKWRWGATADDLLIQGAPLGIKFALGENVKQSSAQSFGRTTAPRYPQTRMGVEEIIRDRYDAALDYEREWKVWEKDKTKIPPRRDLELEPMLEVVKGKRLVHAHGYRADEMLMLMRVAEEYGFRIASFEHALEGYKIADVMAKHGAAGASFSDWWAYKMEVWDAIIGSGPLMHSQGVSVSYNSDNNQLASRLNWECAKAVKFGLSEEEAFKFVTINAAKQLGVGDKMGSLESGKDADFVIWSGNPLSVYSKCEQTWVDGRKFFDLQEDKQLREQIQKERAALIQKVIVSKRDRPGITPADGAPTRFRRPNDQGSQSLMEDTFNEN